MASKALQIATTIDQCLKAKQQFQSIYNYDGVMRKMAECDAKIESIRSGVYNTAKSYQSKGDWNSAIDMYKKKKAIKTATYKSQYVQMQLRKQKRENDSYMRRETN